MLYLEDRSRLVLGGLLALFSLAAVVFHRPGWEERKGEEATYVLQAESLVRDFDLTFGAADRQRLEERGDPRAGDLVLRPKPDAADAVYARPLPYSVLLAPFVRLAPQRGPTVVNLLLLWSAAWLAANSLMRRLGPSAPLLIALCIFASVTFRYALLAQPEIFLLAAAVAAFSLAVAHEEPALHSLQEIYRPPQTFRRVGGRWLLVGLLLGLLAVHHPVYLGLVLPAAVLVPGDRRRQARVALIVGLLTVLATCTVAERARTGRWVLSPVELTAMWQQDRSSVAEDQAASMRITATSVNPYESSPGQPLPRRFSGHLTLWNLVYLLVGRNLGLLPLFPPLLLLVGMWTWRSRRSTLVVTVLCLAGLIALVSPFNFAGAPSGIGNRWFVPLFGALWLVPVQPPRRRWLTAVLLVAAPFLYPVWLSPLGDPLAADGSPRHATGRAALWLPIETTQRGLPHADEIEAGGLWVRSLNRAAALGADRRWRLQANQPAELVIAAPSPLQSLFLQFGAAVKPELEIEGGKLGNLLFQPDGQVGFEVTNLDLRARHPMWWSDQVYQLYVLRLELPDPGGGPQSFRIAAVARGAGDERP
jgi:hypothetical protein